MKAIVKYTLLLVTLLLGSCYGDEFDGLNEEIGGLNNRLESLEGQVEGLTELVNGLQEVQNRLTTLEEALTALPQSSGLSDGLSDLLRRMEALEQGLGNLDPDNGGLQGEIDALNAELDQLQQDLAQLLENGNVYPGDMVITSEEELDAVLDFMEGRETLIVNGAVLIFPYDSYFGVPFYAPEQPQSFEWDAEVADKLFSVTSRITAILGKNLEVNYPSYGYYEPEIEEGFWNIFPAEEIPYFGLVAGYMNFDLEFPLLTNVNGTVTIEFVDGNVSLPQMRLMDDFSTFGFYEYGYGLDEVIASIDIFTVNGNVDVSGLTFANNFYASQINGTLNVSNLSLVKADFRVSEVTSVDAKKLRKVQGEFYAHHGGGYDYPDLEYVGSYFELVDVGTGIEGVEPTTTVKFPKLVYSGEPIRVSDMDTSQTDNEFSNATYVEILGFFSDNYKSEPSYRGFGAPLAETVIVHGESYGEEEEFIIKTDLYVDAPLADVTLTFDDTYDYEDPWSGDGDLTAVFKTLKAENLEYVDGDLRLIGPEDGVASELEVSLPSLVYVYGIVSEGVISLSNIASFKAPKYVQTTAMIIVSEDLRALTLGSAYDFDIDMGALESLTLTGLRSMEAPFYLFELDETNINPATLKNLNITGFTKAAGTEDYYLDTDVELDVCSNNVIVWVGSISGGATSFTALETVSIHNVADVELVGASLTTFTGSGNYVSWNNVGNAIDTINTTWTLLECDGPL